MTAGRVAKNKTRGWTRRLALNVFCRIAGTDSGFWLVIARKCPPSRDRGRQGTTEATNSALLRCRRFEAKSRNRDPVRFAKLRSPMGELASSMALIPVATNMCYVVVVSKLRPKIVVQSDLRNCTCRGES